jgi:hypothetical protein
VSVRCGSVGSLRRWIRRRQKVRARYVDVCHTHRYVLCHTHRLDCHTYRHPVVPQTYMTYMDAYMHSHMHGYTYMHACTSRGLSVRLCTRVCVHTAYKHRCGVARRCSTPPTAMGPSKSFARRTGASRPCHCKCASISSGWRH